MATDTVLTSFLMLDEDQYAAHLALHEGMRQPAWLRPIRMTIEQFMLHLRRHEGHPCELFAQSERGTTLCLWVNLKYLMHGNSAISFLGAPFVEFACGTGTVDHSTLKIPGLPGFKFYPEWDNPLVELGTTVTMSQLVFQLGV
jgi:hypothetical protein